MVPTLSIRDVVPFSKVIVGSDKVENKSCKTYLFLVMWLDAPVLMIQILRTLEVKHAIWLPNCPMVIVDDDGVICCSLNYWNIWYLQIFLSDITILLDSEKVCPSEPWVTWANWLTWEVLLYNFRYLFLMGPTSL